MKKQKKLYGMLGAAALILGAGFTVFGAQDSDMVTVEVKDAKGSALEVYYEVEGEEYTEKYYLPIGEPVQIPKGTTLISDPISSYFEWDWYWESELMEKYDFNSIATYLANVYAEEKNGGTKLLYSTDEWEGTDKWKQALPWEYTVEEDCTIIPEFAALMDIWYEGVEAETSTSDSKRYLLRSESVRNDSPSAVNVDIRASRGSEKIKFSEVPSVGFDKEDSFWNSEYEELFELTETGLKSKTVLPPGSYHIPIKYCWDVENDRYAHNFVLIQIGASADLAIHLTESYPYNDGMDKWYFSVGSCGIPAKDDDGNFVWYFDKASTTTGDILKNIESMPEDLHGYSRVSCVRIAGYEKTGTYKDDSGKILTADSKTLLKDVTKGSRYTVYPVFKKGTKTFEPFRIRMFTDDDVALAYYNSWKEENGLWFYYDENGVMVKNQWVVKNGKPAFCGSDGVLAVNGIAGISMNDEDGLWLVDADGARRTGFTGIETIGMMAYIVENGRVIDMETVKTATPSNATEVKKLADSLDISMDALNDDEKAGFADMLSAGITAMKDSEKEALEESTLEKIDRLLKDIYGIEADVQVKTDGEIADEDLLEDTVKAVGLLAASGINSASEDTKIRLEITQKPTASASNADSLLLWFDAKMYVNEEIKQLKSPIIMEIKLPESFRNYPKALYNFSGLHIKDNGARSTFTPRISDDLKDLKIRANSFSQFQILARKKTTSTSSSHGSSGPKKKGTVNANTIQDTSTGKTGQWVQDGDRWWFRYSDGTWPHSCWAELDWYGIRNWYYFDEAGYMVTGWKHDGENTYYLHTVSDGTRGRMYTGWNQINSVWYYFNTISGGSKGALLKNTTTPDGYQVGADGAWIQ